MKATGLAQHVRFRSLIGASHLELYIARDALDTVNTIVNDCPDLRYVDRNPAEEAVNPAAHNQVRNATIHRFGHFYHHAPFALLRESILEGYPPDIQEAAIAFSATLTATANGSNRSSYGAHGSPEPAPPTSPD